MHPRATTCPVALEPAPHPRWASGLPRVQRLRNPLPWWEMLWCRHVYGGSGPARTPERYMSCGSGSCLLAGRAPGCLCSKASWSDCAARLTCSKRTHACLQGAWRQGHHGPTKCVSMHHIQCLQDVWTSGYNTATLQCHHCWPLACHRYSAGRPDSTASHYWPSAAW
jgi:hypothetical protein